jgi:hypothetical protein
LRHNGAVQQTGRKCTGEVAGKVVAGTDVKQLDGPAADLKGVMPNQRRSHGTI